MTWRVVFEPEGRFAQCRDFDSRKEAEAYCERMKVHDEGAVVVEIEARGKR